MLAPGHRGADRRPVRAVVCDDVREFRLLLRLELEEGDAIEVVGEAADGLEVVRRARRALPGVRLIVLSGLHASVMEEPAVKHGADRYVEKGEPLPTLRCAVLQLAGACE